MHYLVVISKQNLTVISPGGLQGKRRQTQRMCAEMPQSVSRNCLYTTEKYLVRKEPMPKQRTLGKLQASPCLTQIINSRIWTHTWGVMRAFNEDGESMQFGSILQWYIYYRLITSEFTWNIPTFSCSYCNSGRGCNHFFHLILKLPAQTALFIPDPIHIQRATLSLIGSYICRTAARCEDAYQTVGLLMLQPRTFCH